ncbi:MAG TPA: KaiC domain-containing protein [Candidatus Aenigmarchaeota archaeon]|nr:KaiC domain-containing protein [Candidatus Aenigmarchaeota archaeon]
MEKIIKDAVKTLGEVGKGIPKLFGISTGVEGLDDMFFVTQIENGKVKKVSLGGFPFRAVINLTGIPETGKSLIAEQFAIKQASMNYNVCFVTVESPSAFVAQGMRERARAMGVEWEKVENNIIMIDAASNSSLREDIPTLLNTLAYAIKNYNVKSVVIDSITGLYEAREMLARGIVRDIFNFLKKWGQTALLISQKRSSHEEETAEAAGGYAVSHICDSTIVVSKKLIQKKWEEEFFKVPIGNILRTIRIDGCRMCGHDTSTHVLYITDLGIVKVGPKLEDLRRGNKW